MGGLYPSNIDHKNMACLDSVNGRNLEGSVDGDFVIHTQQCMRNNRAVKL